MDEDGAKEPQASSSKKENSRGSSDEDHALHEDKRKYDNRQKYDERGTDAVSNSGSFASSYSARSRLDMVKANRGTKPKRQKRHRLIGKVEKRRRSATRRRAIRRAPKRKPRVRKDREPSVSTIFTRLTSGSGSQGCNFCGHRCCRRRYIHEKRRRMRRLENARKQRQARKICSTKQIQAGSRCIMLSPLFITTNLPRPSELPEAQITFSQITPEMIYETVRRLTMWMQYTRMPSIYQYIKCNYPVNPEERALQAELDEKLYVASLAGIISKVEDGWCLNCRLQDRYITQNHVTKFWDIYADTLKPVEKKLRVRPKEEQTEDRSVSNSQLEQLFKRKII